MIDKTEDIEYSNGTFVPNEFFDEDLAELTDKELRVALYVIRRTRGFGKLADAISYNQFKNGITTKDGKVLDHGCGIKHDSTLSAAIASLEAKGKLKPVKSKTNKGDNGTTVYTYCFKRSPKAASKARPDRGVLATDKYGYSRDTSTGTCDRQVRVLATDKIQKKVTQKKVTQKKDKQEGIESFVDIEASVADATPSPSSFSFETETKDEVSHTPTDPLLGSSVASKEKTAGAKLNNKQASTKPEFTPAGAELFDAWASLFKTPPAKGPKTIEQANELAEPVKVWAEHLGESMAQVLQRIRSHCVTSNPTWFRDKGVRLHNIHSGFEDWQSWMERQGAVAKPSPQVESERADNERRRASRQRYEEDRARAEEEFIAALSPEQKKVLELDKRIRALQESLEAHPRQVTYKFRLEDAMREQKQIMSETGLEVPVFVFPRYNELALEQDAGVWKHSA